MQSDPEVREAERLLRAGPPAPSLVPDPGLLEHCREWTDRVRHRKRGKGVRTRKVDATREDEDVDLWGHVADHLVARELGSEADCAVLVGAGRSHDTRVRGLTVVVKFTFHEHGRLMFDDRHPFEADLAVLTRPGLAGTVEPAGFVDRRTFREHAFAEDLGYGPRMVLPMGQLGRWGFLVEWAGADWGEGRRIA